MLLVKKVSKSFGGTKAVDGISMEFFKQNITGIIGPNGAGKTTVFNIINGFIKSDKGEIFYKDKKITGLKPFEISRLGIGRLFQNTRIFPNLTCIENILVAHRNTAEENPKKAR